MEQLPLELIEHIASHLNYEELSSFRLLHPVIAIATNDLIHVKKKEYRKYIFYYLSALLGSYLCYENEGIITCLQIYWKSFSFNAIDNISSLRILKTWLDQGSYNNLICTWQNGAPHFYHSSLDYRDAIRKLYWLNQGYGRIYVNNTYKLPYCLLELEQILQLK